MSFDVILFQYLHGLAEQADWFDTLVIFIADGFDVTLLILTLVIILVLYDPNPETPYFSVAEMKQRLKGLGMVILSTGIAWSVVASLKSLFATPRPFLALPDINPLFYYGGYDSFPSGHAAFFAALTVGLYIYNKKIGIVFGFFALLIGLSRIIVGVHFPFDILVGYLLGGGIAWILYEVYKYIHRHVTVDIEL